MKVLGINGSPRIGGNTDILLDKALEGAKDAGADTEKIALGGLTFSPCLECERLKDYGNCIVEDDMRAVYKKVKEADALIVASPVFFGSLSAQTKMMIDRFQCAWGAKYILKKDIFKKKTGAFISAAASDRKDFFENSKAIVKNFFAVVNAAYKEELFCSGVDEKAAVLKRGDCLEKARRLGEKTAEPGGR